MGSDDGGERLRMTTRGRRMVLIGSIVDGRIDGEIREGCRSRVEVATRGQRQADGGLPCVLRGKADKNADASMLSHKKEGARANQPGKSIARDIRIQGEGVRLRTAVARSATQEEEVLEPLTAEALVLE